MPLPLVVLAGWMLFLATVPTLAAPLDQDTTLLRLRQALHEADPEVVALAQWNLAQHPDPCKWGGVSCNAQGHVVQLEFIAAGTVSTASPSPALPSPPPSAVRPSSSQPLIPELAQLPWLEYLKLTLNVAPASIPPEWLQPGAFPRLQHLTLRAPSLGGMLPDIAPGALPLLRHLELRFDALHSTLPPQWGSSPSVLPALQLLALQLQPTGQLPAAWAGGFAQLRTLTITAAGAENSRTRWQHAEPAEPTAKRTGVTGRAASTSWPPRPRMTTVPPEWGSGAFPKLESLILDGIGLQGPFPQALLERPVPGLHDLYLQFNDLTGALPAELFEKHPGLVFLQLGGNHFSILPHSWGRDALKLAVLGLGSNNLTGPAFPASWLQPGSMPQLITLDLSRNPGLAGTLPRQLPWTQLMALRLDGTGVNGTIPADWCQAPFHNSLQWLWVNKSAASPTLPDCASQSMPLLVSQNPCQGDNCGGGLAPTSSNAPQGHPAPRKVPSAVAASLGTLLALGVMAAAGTAGRVLWWRALLRRQQRQRWRLLPSQPSMAGGAEAELAAADVSLPPSCPQDTGVASPHAQVAALLRGVLGQPQQVPGLPHHALVRMVSGQQQQQRSPASAPQSPLAHRLGLASLPANFASVGRHSPAYSPTTDEAGQEAEALLPAAEGSRASTADCSAQHSSLDTRQFGAVRWLLQGDVASLRLLPDELGFITDASGELVVLGAGSHGSVYLASLGGVDIAAKVMAVPARLDPQTVWREVFLLRQCSHERIVPLYGVMLQGQLLILALALMRGGSLRDALGRRQARAELRWNRRGRQVAIDVAEALAHMHSKNVLHNDLKSSNVLLSEEYRAFVGDFGLAKAVSSVARSAGGFTRAYAAPEQLLGHQCTLAADVYSLGVLLIELSTQKQAEQRGMWRLPTTPEDCPQAVLALIQDCLRTDPLQRPTAPQVLERLRAAGA